MEYTVPTVVVGDEPAPPVSPEASPGAVQDGAHMPATPDPIVFASPPSHVPSGIDLDDAEAPRRYRLVTDSINSSEPRQLDLDELLFAATEEPSTFEQANKDPAWRAAMHEELASIIDNGTWQAVDLPGRHRPIGLKWVFKLKKDASGAVVRHKARLVVKGYAQVAGVDYDEVFTPVTRLDTVRVLLAMAAHEGWEVHHMDVKSAFLN